MLRKRAIILAAILAIGGSLGICSESQAESCASQAILNGQYETDTISVSVTCENQPDSTSYADDSEADGSAVESAEPECFYFDYPISCTDWDYQWYPEINQY